MSLNDPRSWFAHPLGIKTAYLTRKESTMEGGRKIAYRTVGLLLLLAWVGSGVATAAQDGPVDAGAAGAVDVAATPAPVIGAAREIMTRVFELLAEYGLKVIGAVLIVLVGRWVAKLLSGLVGRVLARAKLDPTLVPFLENLSYTGMLVFVAVAALDQVGVETASFIAVLGAAGLAVGLALQGSLANFASGVLLLVFKPFRVGDFVEVGDAKGKVQAIQIFNTVLNSPDNVRIIVPNGQVTGGSIRNYTVNSTRRIDLVVSVSYDDDLRKARRVIETVLAADPRILADPAPIVAVSEMADSSMDFIVRPWVKTTDYWDVYWDLTEKLKVAMDEHGLTIPFPQQEIYIKTDTPAAALKSA